MAYIRVVKPALYSGARPLRSCEQSLLAIPRSNLKTRSECDFSSVVFWPQDPGKASSQLLNCLYVNSVNLMLLDTLCTILSIHVLILVLKVGLATCYSITEFTGMNFRQAKTLFKITF